MLQCKPKIGSSVCFEGGHNSTNDFAQDTIHSQENLHNQNSLKCLFPKMGNSQTTVWKVHLGLARFFFCSLTFKLVTPFKVMSIGSDPSKKEPSKIQAGYWYGRCPSACTVEDLRLAWENAGEVAQYRANGI